MLGDTPPFMFSSVQVGPPLKPWHIVFVDGTITCPDDITTPGTQLKEVQRDWITLVFDKPLTSSPARPTGNQPKPNTEVSRRRSAVSAVNGRLPADVIQSVVRKRFSTFRTCYEEGLRKDPTLKGRVAVRFVIDLDGRVSSASDARSDLPDATVLRCITDTVRELVFPKPEGGIVTVVYPIEFSPGD